MCFTLILMHSIISEYIASVPLEVIEKIFKFGTKGRLRYVPHIASLAGITLQLDPSL